MAQAELFWIFLDDLYPLEDLKKLNLTGFDWSSRHENGQTVLARHICNTLMRGSPGPSNNYKDGLETMEWLIHSGANTEQKCLGAESCFSWLWWKPPFCVRYGGLSAISYTRALQKKLRSIESIYGIEEGEKTVQLPQKKAFLAKVLQLFAAVSTDSSPNVAGPRVSIHESIAELWEKSLAAKDSHDLTIETADGLVTAHAHMLKAASSVVAAMLESPMKESKSARIEIKDTSGKAASLFLEILYTCSAQEEPEYETALGALDLAHRWQVEAVVAILTDLLAGMITDASFAAIAEHALLKGLERLKTAAQRFGAESRSVQADLKAGRLPAVAQLFHGRSNPSKPKPKPKRRWM